AALGFGAGWFGAVRSVLPLAAPAERSALMSAFYLECYLANALPVIAAGAAVRPLGLLRTADCFGAAVMALAALALALSAARRVAAIRHRALDLA
ncbi:MAG: MFS transporter, partial [Gluconacetobacter diazotrophicus]|nr:MFS transporter [Gluconacetobacter diazotrophicus]